MAEDGEGELWGRKRFLEAGRLMGVAVSLRELRKFLIVQIDGCEMVLMQSALFDGLVLLLEALAHALSSETGSEEEDSRGTPGDTCDETVDSAMGSPGTWRYN